MLPTPGTILAAIVVWLGLFGMGYVLGTKNTNNARDAELLIQTKATVYQLNVRNKALADLSAKLEKAKNERTVEYRTLTQQVDRVVKQPVYRNVCLDADGLRIANTALAGGHAAAASELNANLPQPAGDKRR